MWVVVVESPAKARTVGRFLGRGWRVLACHGHVRDLPAKAGSVKPDDGFAMVYETAGRRAARALGAIRAALGDAEGLILATDPDREGEAIAWRPAARAFSWSRRAGTARSWAAGPGRPAITAGRLRPDRTRRPVRGRSG